MSEPTILLQHSWRGKEWAWPHRVERLQHNTIHPDIIEDIAEAALGLPGLPCVQLKRNTSSFVLYYWCIVQALSTNELCRPPWPADPARAHCPGSVTEWRSYGVTGPGPLCHSRPRPGPHWGSTLSQSSGWPRGSGLWPIKLARSDSCIVVWRWLAPSVFSVQKAR